MIQQVHELDDDLGVDSLGDSDLFGERRVEVPERESTKREGGIRIDSEHQRPEFGSDLRRVLEYVDAGPALGRVAGRSDARVAVLVVIKPFSRVGAGICRGGDGIFVVRTGSVKLAESSEEGQSLRSRIAGPGEILGLPAALIACPYRAAAQLLEPSEIGFVDREKFSIFLCEHGAVGLRLVRLLSRALTNALDQVRVALTLSPWKV